jgi:hypothetical protein
LEQLSCVWITGNRGNIGSFLIFFIIRIIKHKLHE